MNGKDRWWPSVNGQRCLQVCKQAQAFTVPDRNVWILQQVKQGWECATLQHFLQPMRFPGYEAQTVCCTLPHACVWVLQTKANLLKTFFPAEA